MIQNKMICFRPLGSMILSVFFLLVMVTPYASADTKIGPDPERGPIKTWTDPVTGMAFVWVPGGCYQMGCGSWAGNCDSDEEPVHEVCLDGFWMGKYEVTIGQYRKFLQDGGSRLGVDWKDEDCPLGKGRSHALSGNKFGSSDNQPMVEVSWYGAKAFAAWLSGKTGKRLRLPTEAQWEYACRSGGKPERYAGEEGRVGRVAWYSRNSGGRTHEVGTKAPNGLGIFDMSGNVWEWCRDWYGKYGSSSRKNPTGPAGGSSRVIRGGYWYDPAEVVRCGFRDSYNPGVTFNYLGFRLVRTH
ncbi:MAG: formylglycine-generating enzyme family protein [Deltaproteobacteria bacterium]|jgi:formylglycine-generating enzyme required for sulfatase activity|nr:formylglycine-generating enzyme family protein [Deltaproteobacteria bacterium]